METGYYDATWTTVTATHLGLAGAGRQTGEMPPPAGTQSLPVGDETAPGCHSTRDTPKQIEQKMPAEDHWGDDREGWSCQDCVRTFSQPHKHVGSNLLRTPCPTVTGMSPSGSPELSLDTWVCVMRSELR